MREIYNFWGKNYEGKLADSLPLITDSSIEMLIASSIEMLILFWFARWIWVVVYSCFTLSWDGYLVGELSSQIVLF